MVNKLIEGFICPFFIGIKHGIENKGSVYFLNAMFFLQVVHSVIESFVEAIGNIEALWLTHNIFVIRFCRLLSRLPGKLPGRLSCRLDS